MLEVYPEMILKLNHVAFSHISGTLDFGLHHQVTKDKRYANLQMEVSNAMKHGKSKSTIVAFELQTVGK
ncbi:chloroplast protein import component Toc86/159 [Artemisia annua]|uniref:Chloroplast protein import component Toc86/159 n=1 Tax=Artemisia annua TaxID=35608 RepID=A0A2U1KG73_ARTAN|nr:chloroplast protein import component Toc86/159 [Artemisia annua]